LMTAVTGIAITVQLWIMITMLNTRNTK